MSGSRPREFAWYEGFALCVAAIATQLSSEVMNQWGFYFYSPSEGVGRTVYVTIRLVWIIFLVGTLWDAVTDPMIGTWSDRTSTRPRLFRYFRPSGRRRPFIFWGSILMTVTAVAFWYPPVEGASYANLAYGSLLLCLHWTVFTITVVPLLALAPEIARSEAARVRLATWVAVGMIVGLAMAAVAPGALIVQLDPARIREAFSVRLSATGDTAPDTGRVEEAALAILPEDRRAQPEFVTGENGVTTVVSGPLEGQIEIAEGEDGFSIAFLGDLIGQIEAAHGAQAVAALVPDGLRDKAQVASAGGKVSVILPDDPGRQVIIVRTEDQVSVTVPEGLVGEQEATQFGESVKAALPEEFRGLIDFAYDNNGFSATFRENLAGQLAFVREEGRLSTFLDAELTAGVAAVHVGNTVSALFPPGTVEVARAIGSFSAVGYRRLALVLALLSMVLFQFPVWLVKERYDSEEATEPETSFIEGLRDVSRNRPFIVYGIAFFLFFVGFMGTQRALPYWAELGLGGDEGTVTVLMIPFLLTALASYAVIPWITRRLRLKWMMFIAFLIIATGLPWMYVIGTASIEARTKIVLGCLLFGYCGIGQGIMYVMMPPMVGECIDYDEKRSGRRREALYNGLSGFVVKASVGGGIALASLSMSTWGNSLEDATGVFLVGPIAGLFALCGLVTVLFYPVLHVTLEHPGEAGSEGKSGDIPLSPPSKTRPTKV